ncbi:MAG: hypothetical protein U0T77_04615 [Chitinophagales bacterium]
MKCKLILAALLLSFSAKAQLAPDDFIKIKALEDTIRIYGDTLINSQLEENRTIASYRIIKSLSKALKIKNSFYYRWDSTLPWKVVMPEDGSFKVFTWYTRSDIDLYKYFGTVQLKSDTLKMFPLIDYSDFTDHQEDINVDNGNWIGSLYYGIKTVKAGKKTYYTLFGWDGNNKTSNKKIMEILSFNKQGKIRFGAPIIDMGKGKILNRFILEFSDEATATLAYNESEKKVIYDHIIPNGDALEGFFGNYIPDGTYEGFEWKKGKWKHVNEIGYEKRKDGDVPNVIKKQSLELYTPKTK